MHGLDTAVAKYFIVIPVVAALWVWYQQSSRHKKEIIYIGIIGVIIAGLLTKIASSLFYNPRPFVKGNFTPYFSHANDNGFPSDHTLLAAYLAFLVWLYDRRLGYGLAVVTVLIGLSRVIAGIHHLIDIIGSITIALISVYIARQIVKKFLASNRHKAHEA